MSLPETETDARHRDRLRPRKEDLLRIPEIHDELDELPRRGRLLRDRDEEVEEMRPRLTRRVDEEETSPAEPGERALADPGDRGGRDAGIHGIATHAQNVRSSLCGERMTGC